MRVGVLGTGIVGRTLAGKLGELGDDVSIGTRDPAALAERTEPDYMENPPSPSGKPIIRVSVVASTRCS
jgi:8-hydroxy-5-deazaflavin:NADPH oxidoreductase